MGRFLIALAVAAMLIPSLPAAAAARTHGCGPSSARTIERSAAVRVYFVERRGTKTYYACWRRTHGKPVNLAGGVYRPEFVNQFRLRGRYLTFVYTLCSTDTGCDSFAVQTVDVKRRRAVVGTDSQSGRVVTLLATRGGAAAFLATTGHEQYVQKLDSLGVEEIDRGADVRSLTLRGARLHWLHGTQARDDHIAHVRRCGPSRGAVTEALSKRLRVYYSDPYLDDELQHYACLLGGGKPLPLGEDIPGGSAYSNLEDFQLRGDHVVWLDTRCSLWEACQSQIHSADVRRRTILDGDGYHDTPLVIVNDRGFAAEVFLSGGYEPGAAPSYTLLAFDSAGERQVDEGERLDPDSVAVFADSIVWRHDGEQRSTLLR
jgi:hypothetical protein